MVQLIDKDEQNETLLMHEVAHLLRKCFDRKAQRLDLSRSQWRALSIIRRNPGIRQANMADLMEVEPITLARLVDRMEKSAWIKRQADPKDRRANNLFLTDKAKDITKEMFKMALDMRNSALAGFSKKEHDDLLKYLSRIKMNTIEMLTDDGEKL